MLMPFPNLPFRKAPPIEGQKRRVGRDLKETRQEGKRDRKITVILLQELEQFGIHTLLKLNGINHTVLCFKSHEVGGRGLRQPPSLPSAPFLPVSLHCWDHEDRLRMLCHAGTCLAHGSVLLRAPEGQLQTPRSTRGFQLAQHPPAPGEIAVSHPSAPWLGRRAPPSRVQHNSFPDKQEKGCERVSGSSLASNLSCFLLPLLSPPRD